MALRTFKAQYNITITYRLHYQLTDWVTDYFLYILYVMWYYALPKQSIVNVACRSWLYTCTFAKPVSHNTYIIAVLLRYLCGATSTIHLIGMFGDTV